MRSIYAPTILSENDEFTVATKLDYHHLAKVVRIKNGEQVLFLNGLGITVRCEVVEVDKNAIYFKKIETSEKQRQNNLSLAICKTKKDALDEIIKSAVELGINSVYLLESEFSQRFPINKERMDKLIISAMEQSNNPFFLDVTLDIPFTTFVENNNESMIYFAAGSLNKGTGPVHDKSILLIGPEGGLSNGEEMLLSEYNVPFCHLDTWILRSKTAIACATGYLIGCADGH
jgi:16S rRNA (uracil1498-N3)-methyltransferase